MRYAVVTFGCRVNQADSLAVEAGLTGAGDVAVSPDRAEVVLVNTCSVTASADQGARQTIRRIHRENPGARIVVTGCYASRCGDEVADLPGVAEVVPNDDKPRLLAILRPSRRGHRRRAVRTDARTRIDGPHRVDAARPDRLRRAVQLLHHPDDARDEPQPDAGGRRRRAGCARWTRATRRSRSPASISAGGGAISPAGQTLGDLLAGLAAVPGDVRVRVSSLEPMDCTPDVLGWLVDRPDRFAPHLHLPLQHASDRMLQAMRRPYSGAAYARLVDDVRARLPHAAIGSDVIVGFPGETDDDAEALAGYLERSPLTHLHVFPYSDRPGTVAERLPGKVHGAVVKARAQRLRAVSRVLSDRFRASQAGTIRPALTIDDGTMAVTDNYFKVPVPDGAGAQRVGAGRDTGVRAPAKRTRATAKA